MVERALLVSVSVQLRAQGVQGAQPGQSPGPNVERAELGPQEPLFEGQVVRHHDRVGQVRDQVTGDVGERGGSRDLGFGDLVELGVAQRDAGGDQGRVFVQDGAVAAHAHDGHLTDAVPLFGVQSGGLHVQDGEHHPSWIGSPASGQAALAEHRAPSMTVTGVRRVSGRFLGMGSARATLLTPHAVKPLTFPRQRTHTGPGEISERAFHRETTLTSPKIAWETFRPLFAFLAQVSVPRVSEVTCPPPCTNPRNPWNLRNDSAFPPRPLMVRCVDSTNR